MVFSDWAKQTFGAEVIANVGQLARTPIKISKAEKEELYRHYRAELKRLQEMRNDGKQGRIPFTNPWWE